VPAARGDLLRSRRRRCHRARASNPRRLVARARGRARRTRGSLVARLRAQGRARRAPRDRAATFLSLAATADHCGARRGEAPVPRCRTALVDRDLPRAALARGRHPRLLRARSCDNLSFGGPPVARIHDVHGGRAAPGGRVVTSGFAGAGVAELRRRQHPGSPARGRRRVVLLATHRAAVSCASWAVSWITRCAASPGISS